MIIVHYITLLMITNLGLSDALYQASSINLGMEKLGGDLIRDYSMGAAIAAWSNSLGGLFITRSNSATVLSLSQVKSNQIESVNTASGVIDGDFIYAFATENTDSNVLLKASLDGRTIFKYSFARNVGTPIHLGVCENSPVVFVVTKTSNTKLIMHRFDKDRMVLLYVSPQLEFSSGFETYITDTVGCVLYSRLTSMSVKVLESTGNERDVSSDSAESVYGLNQVDFKAVGSDRKIVAVTGSKVYYGSGRISAITLSNTANFYGPFHESNSFVYISGSIVYQASQGRISWAQEKIGTIATPSGVVFESTGLFLYVLSSSKLIKYGLLDPVVVSTPLVRSSASGLVSHSSVNAPSSSSAKAELPTSFASTVTGGVPSNRVIETKIIGASTTNVAETNIGGSTNIGDSKAQNQTLYNLSLSATIVSTTSRQQNAQVSSWTRKTTNTSRSSGQASSFLGKLASINQIYLFIGGLGLVMAFGLAGVFFTRMSKRISRKRPIASQSSAALTSLGKSKGDIDNTTVIIESDNQMPTTFEDEK